MSDKELQNDHRPTAEACMSRARSSRNLSGEKVAKRNKSKAYREINRLNIELEKTKKDIYKLKKRGKSIKRDSCGYRRRTKTQKALGKKLNIFSMVSASHHV